MYHLLLDNFQLKRHVASVHEEKKPFTICNICSAIYARNEKLKSHKTSVHERTNHFQCNVCGTKIQCMKDRKLFNALLDCDSKRHLA